jgi:AcrR family transcriptional regulator
VVSTEPGGRANQLRRTRKDLLQAASRLVRAGRHPSLEEVAEAAMVSRATAYRHFPDVSALLVEASLDVDTPQAEDVFRGAPPAEPVARLERVDAALERMIRDNELAVRLMLKHALDRSVRHADTSRARWSRRGAACARQPTSRSPRRWPSSSEPRPCSC